MSDSGSTVKIGIGGTIIQAPPSESRTRRYSPGETLAGIYRVERFLGEGGMGVVFGARHLPTGRVVALKVLHTDMVGAESVARFWREVRAVSLLQDPHVVRIFDVGTLADETPYMAMELLEGETLAKRLEREGPLPIERARDYVLQACDAVAAAHAIGVVHRDLKPENMFITRLASGGEILKVVDFGISKTMRATMSDDQQKLTKTTDVFGSPTYMSPEQLRASRDVDARTDVWSLGVILHELIAGKPPFEAGSVAEIFGAILYQPTPPLTEIRGDVPRELEAVVLRALEKDLAQRFADVPSFAAALAQSDQPAAPDVPRRTLVPIIALIAFLAAAAAAFIAAGLFR